MRPEVRNLKRRSANHTYVHFRQKRTHDRQSAARPTGGHHKPSDLSWDDDWGYDYDEEEEEEEEEHAKEDEGEEEFWNTFAQEFWDLYDEFETESNDSDGSDDTFFVDADGVMHVSLMDGMDYKQAILTAHSANEDQRAFIVEALKKSQKKSKSKRQHKFHTAVVKALHTAWERKEYPTSPRAKKHIEKKAANKNNWGSRHHRHGNNRVAQRPMVAAQ